MIRLPVRSEPSTKRKPTARAAREITPAMAAAKERSSRIAQTFASQNLAQARAWREHTDAVNKNRKKREKRLAPNQLYLKYCHKLLQVNPEATLPLWPPDYRFRPEEPRISVEAAPASDCRDLPGLQVLHERVYPRFKGEGFLVFRADRANPIDVTTEIFLARVPTDAIDFGWNGGPHALRSGPEHAIGFYRFRGGYKTLPLFDADPDGDPYANRLALAVPVKPGWYRCSFRSVNVLTGQSTHMLQSKLIRVEATI